MGLNLVTSIEICHQLKEQFFSNLIYYSHIPTAITALFIGFFVFFKNRKDLSPKILFFLAVTFSCWSFLDLIVWVYGYNSILTMFAWALLGLFDVLFFVLCLYFVYVFIDKRDISFRKKTILALLFAPILLLSFSNYNLIGFDAVNCNALENSSYVNYTFAIELFISIWIIILGIFRYVKAERTDKKQIFFVTLGIILFLLSFFASGYIADKLSASGYPWAFQIEQYGLFGMVVFMGFLAYLIVKFKAFHIKLLAAQALVAGLIIGIGAQFFFIQNSTNMVLNGVTLAIAIIFGYQLVKSVKLEVQRKEELEKLSTELAEANTKLHQLDKAKSEFISIASHQLRTPLTAIKGFVSLLLEGTYGQVPDTQKSALEKVYVSNERLVQLVEDLLNISRIESGRMEFDFQEAQIEDMIDEAVSTLDLSAKNRNLYLTWQKPSKPLPKLKMDITKIKEVVSNMIDNAIKYTQKGGVTVRTELGEGVMRVVVSDTGIGMDQEDIEQIFEKFQRGKEISHYHTDGTGLGMFIARKVVTAHRGRVWAESEGKGKGSRFILELPVG